MPQFFLRGCRTRLIRIKRLRFVMQDAFALGVDVLELTALHGPAEHRQDRKDEAGGQRDEQVQAFHVRAECCGLQRAARSALSTTTSELLAMPRPAAHGGNQPTSASGMHSAL